VNVPITREKPYSTTGKSSVHSSGKRGGAKFNLLRSYGLASFVVLATIGSLSGLLFSNYMADSLLKRDAFVSQAFLQSLTEVEGGAEVFQRSLTENTTTRQEPVYNLPELVDHIATMPGVVRANLYSRDGKVLWSTQTDLIGEVYPANAELDEALTGKLVYELSNVQAGDKAEYAQFSSNIIQVIENYLPIWDTDNRKAVVAVVEIYKAPQDLFESIQSARYLVWFDIIISTLFLYATLFWIVYRASKLIHSQQLKLVESETLAAVGEMAAAVAHSIRNPLAAIRSSAELTTELSQEAETRETAEDIISESDRLEQWVRELIIFSRPGSTQLRTEHLGEILDHCLQGYQRAMTRNGVTLVRKGSQAMPLVIGDSVLIGQMFNSVIANALEAMPRGGTLTLKTHAESEKFVHIDLSDTGHGIPADQLDKIFEMRATTKRGGLGIGMALVKRIVERHNGSMSLTSEAGKGTTIHFRIPTQ